MKRYYVTFVICDELIFITIDDWCRLSQYRRSINYLITLPYENDDSDSPRYGTKRRRASVWFNLRYNWSRWSLNRSTLLQVIYRYALIKDKENDGASFTCACPTWRMKSRAVKKLRIVKPRWDSSWTNASRISRSVFKDRGFLEEGPKAYRDLSLFFFLIFTFSFRIA